MDTIRWLLLILVLVSVGAFYLFLYKPSYQKFYDRGIKRYAEQEYERAATEFLKAISEAEESEAQQAREVLIDASMMTAEIYNLRLGKLQEAIQQYEEVAKNFPHHRKAVLALDEIASIYLNKLDDPRKGIETLVQLVNRVPKPDHVMRYKQRILQAYLSLHEFEQAAIEGLDWLKQEPNAPGNGRLLFLVADALGYQAKWQQAIELYKRIENEYPNAPEAKLVHFEIGNCYLKLKRYDEATKAFEKALETYPNADVVRLRIQETKGRLLNETDDEGLPHWVKQRNRNRDVEPFPEDHSRRSIKHIIKDDDEKKAKPSTTKPAKAKPTVKSKAVKKSPKTSNTKPEKAPAKSVKDSVQPAAQKPTTIPKQQPKQPAQKTEKNAASKAEAKPIANSAKKTATPPAAKETAAPEPIVPVTP